MLKLPSDPFSFRDFIQFILPTLIGASLFLPYVSPLPSIETVLVLAALFSYIIATPVSEFARLVYRLIPGVRRRVKELADRREWWGCNWDYDRLFYFLSKDERDYLYLTGSYTEFNRTVSVYVLVYFLVQLGALVRAAIEVPAAGISWWAAALGQTTPMLGGWTAPTMLLAVVAIVLFRYLFANFAQEWEILFLEGGQYVTFAIKYHEAGNRIARSIWGRVGSAQHSVANAEVTLLADGSQLAQTQTDRDGRFQLVDAYPLCLGKGCLVRVKQGTVTVEKELSTDPKAIPYMEFRDWPPAGAASPQP